MCRITNFLMGFSVRTGASFMRFEKKRNIERGREKKKSERAKSFREK